MLYLVQSSLGKQRTCTQLYQSTYLLTHVGIMGITRAVWVGQERVWVGHGLPGLIARTASVSHTYFKIPKREFTSFNKLDDSYASTAH